MARGLFFSVDMVSSNSKKMRKCVFQVVKVIRTFKEEENGDHNRYVIKKRNRCYLEEVSCFGNLHRQVFSVSLSSKLLYNRSQMLNAPVSSLTFPLPAS